MKHSLPLIPVLLFVFVLLAFSQEIPNNPPAPAIPARESGPVSMPPLAPTPATAPDQTQGATEPPAFEILQIAEVEKAPMPGPDRVEAADSCDSVSVANDSPETGFVFSSSGSRPMPRDPLIGEFGAPNHSASSRPKSWGTQLRCRG